MRSTETNQTTLRGPIA